MRGGTCLRCRSPTMDPGPRPASRGRRRFMPPRDAA
jgi:hypothetical protein